MLPHLLGSNPSGEVGPAASHLLIRPDLNAHEAGLASNPCLILQFLSGLVGVPASSLLDQPPVSGVLPGECGVTIRNGFYRFDGLSEQVPRVDVV
jgi:hypothetical protein